MIGVDFGDRAIERWRYMRRVPQQGSGLDRRTIAGEQQITSINVLSLLPRVVSDIPKLVILSRRLSGRPYSSLNLKPACSVIGQNCCIA